MLARAVDALRESRRLLVLTGAGVSTESGIPDFRSKGGIWDRFDPGEFHYGKFLADPKRFWALRKDLMRELDLANARPNATHDAIAAAEAGGRVLGVVTQNIDGLHAAAGTSEPRLVEIHGTARKVRCVECDAWLPFAAAEPALARDELPPPCPECGGVLKPGSVLFGEALPEGTMRRAESWAVACDAMLVVGTSLQVWPVAGLVPLAISRGARVVIVNRESTSFDEDAHAVVRASASEAVPALLAEAGFLPSNVRFP